MKTDKEKTYALVDRNDTSHTIYLGPAFWRASNKTRAKDSKAGTILHELTHFKDIVGTTDDGGYKIKPQYHDQNYDDWKDARALGKSTNLPTCDELRGNNA